MARHLDSHWLQKLAKKHTIIITNRRGFAGSSGHSNLEEELSGLSEVVDIVGTPAI